MKDRNITISFFSNYLNHHQVLIADELYSLLDHNFYFVTTLPRNEKELKGGEDYCTRPYCIMAGESIEADNLAMRLAKESDVCVFGGFSQKYAIARAVQKECGLSFEVGERWLKKGWINILSPRLREWWWNYQRFYRNKPFYKLCSGAFVSNDDRKILAYKNRHYKWGYFTKVDEVINNDLLQIIENSTSEIRLRIMWCSRFIKWKHPELPIYMANKIKGMGYKFVLNMYGIGKEENSIKELSKRLNVDDMVKFHGFLPNTEILRTMQKHDVFLFTSDRNEGWGAVANEAMANGCVLVTSDAIGSTPFLVKDGKNGFIFKSKDVNSLTSRILWLFKHPELMYEIKKEAYKTMVEQWSPKKASIALLRLINDIQNNRKCSIGEGPCSKV